MFRRFMIVCWVVFGLFAVTASAGWTAHWHNKEVRGEIVDVAMENDWNIYFIMEPRGNFPDGMDTPEVRRLIVDDHTAKESMETSRAIAIPASIAAALILLWNMIWHVGHWVWMGRKAE